MDKVEEKIGNEERDERERSTKKREKKKTPADRSGMAHLCLGTVWWESPTTTGDEAVTW